MKMTAIFFAMAAAALYAINIPVSKILLNYVPPTMTAAFLYLGAGVGTAIYVFAAKLMKKGGKKKPLTKQELPYTVAMIVLDTAAPILLMFGVSKTNSANAALLNNFEIVATTIVAFAVFKEIISKRLCFAIFLVTLASVILSFEGDGAFTFNTGSLFVLGACVCWGFENNCTKMISDKSSEEIVVLKGIFSGLGSLAVALAVGEQIPGVALIAEVMILGFVSYGLSINFYITAQKNLGAAKTSAYYSIAPFFGVVFSMIFVGERPQAGFYIALLIMIASTVLVCKDTMELQHTHEHSHVLNGTVYTHTHKHIHSGGSEIHEHRHMYLENAAMTKNKE